MRINQSYWWESRFSILRKVALKSLKSCYIVLMDSFVFKLNFQSVSSKLVEEFEDTIWTVWKKGRGLDPHETFHGFFSNVVKTLKISKNSYLISGTSRTDPVLQSVENFSKHPSTLNRMCNSNFAFSFKFETQEKFSKLTQNLNSNKAMQQYDIPIKILNENIEIY